MSSLRDGQPADSLVTDTVPGTAAGPTVAVTGAAGPLGAAVVERLSAQLGRGVGAVLALDTEQAWREAAQQPTTRWAGPLDTPDEIGRAHV